MSFNNYSAQDPMFPSGDGREDMLGRDLLSRRSIDPMLLEALMEDYDGKKRKKKGKGKKKGKKKEQKVRLLRLEQMVAQVNYQNGVLSHQNDCLDRMMHLALAAQKGTLREPPIEVGFRVLDHGEH